MVVFKAYMKFTFFTVQKNKSVTLGLRFSRYHASLTVCHKVWQLWWNSDLKFHINCSLFVKTLDIESLQVWEESVSSMVFLVNGTNLEVSDTQKKLNVSTIQDISILFSGRFGSNIFFCKLCLVLVISIWFKGDYDATEYRSNCPNGFGSDENDVNCLFLNIMIPDTLLFYTIS